MTAEELGQPFVDASIPIHATPSSLSVDLKLPSLANSFCLVGQAKRADLVWTRSGFLALCEHMLNGNPLTHFLAAWEDSKTGRCRFGKPNRARADKRAGWAWDTITGKAKTKTSLGFYPSNENKMTCWGAIDFDAHYGEHERARRWSLAAFQLLLTHPQLYLVLCTSGGGGFHLFAFTSERYPVSQWILLLKHVCDWIGAEMAPGVCEIFPNEKAESQRVGKGIRAPGTFNPKNNSYSLIEADTAKGLIELLPCTWLGGVGKATTAAARNGATVSLHKSTNTYSLSTEAIIESLIIRYPINQLGTRNGVLMKIVGELVHKFGRVVSERIVIGHYNRYQSNVRTPLEEHLREFGAAWEGLVEKIVNSITPAEKEKYNSLRSEHQQEGFRLIRSFAAVAAHNCQANFPLSRNSLADRLSITPQGAGGIVRFFVESRVIAPTQVYKPHRSCAYYQWLFRA